MSTLSDGLAARDKAGELKPCPFCGGKASIRYEKQYKILLQDWHSPDEALYLPAKIVCSVCHASVYHAENKAKNGGADEAQKKAKVKVVEKWNTRAAPDALDWIAKALPWIKEARDEIQGVIDSYVPEIMSSKSLEAFREDAAQLTALIAEAEGVEKEGENENM